METYNLIANWTGWPFIVALMIIGGSYGYWLMKSQIEILKIANDHLENLNADYKNFSPDLVSQRLADRMKIITIELERMENDNKISKDIMVKKEKELLDAISESIDHSLIRLRFVLSAIVNLNAIIPAGNPNINISLNEIKNNILLASEDLRFAFNPPNVK